MTSVDGLSHLSPVLARIYAARAVHSRAELACTVDKLHPPLALHGMADAVGLLADAIGEGRRILIVADFDADGATSCAVAVRALRALGAADVHFVVPNRFEYGYGLTPEIVAVAARQAPDLIVTVDNGISSVDGVKTARAQGMRVLITDHHLPGAVLPEADAIVNPNQPGCSFPSKNLAGVGVIFYVMLALRAHLRTRNWFVEHGITEPNLAKLLDLVALGTVADVVPLDFNNRILVAQGLARINQRQCCPGIASLLRVAGRAPGRLGAADLGFCVGPRLNAAGRLEDMSLGIACLLTDDDDEAQAIAQQLDALNRERRAIEEGMQEQAWAAIDALALEEARLPRGLCLFNEDWHQGVIGIVAGRLKDRLHRPVIAFAPASDEDLKGSARSVAGVHIRDCLDAVAARHPKLLQKFGGHAMAAGLSIKRAHLPDFSRAFDEEVCRHLDEAQLHGQILSDGELGEMELDLQLAEHLRQGGPWGQGFPEPVFDGRFEVVDHRWLADKHLKLRLRYPGGRRVFDAIAFNHAERADFAARPEVLAAYKLDVNEYEGRRTVQLIIEHLTVIDTATAPVYPQGPVG